MGDYWAVRFVFPMKIHVACPFQTPPLPSSCLEYGSAIVSLEELEFFLPEMAKRGIGELRISQIDEEYFMIDKRW